MNNNNRRIIRMVMLMVCASLLMASCHKKKEEAPTPEDLMADRTVLIYISGENSLSSFINEELDQMKVGSKSIGEKNNLVVYVDAASKYTPPYLMRLKDGVGVDSVSMEESVASDPMVFENVLKTVVSKYAAKDYGLVLWGHANGWLIKGDSIAYEEYFSRRYAYGVDNGENRESNTGNWLNISTMSRVLERTLPNLKFIFADCCQFQCVETAYELRHCCDYIIGSPAEIPGEGAPYQTVVPAMFSQQETYYQEVVDAYYAQTVSSCKEPLSAVNTSEMENLAAATKAVLSSLVPTLSNPKYPDLTGLIYYYGEQWGSEKNFIDMNDFILANASEDEYRTWKQALDRAVVYKTPTVGLQGRWISAQWINFNSFVLDEEHFGGISMFIPQERFNWSVNYNQLIKKTGWYYAAGYAEVGW